MRASWIYPWLGPVSLLLECSGGLVLEPPSGEVFNSVHAKLSLEYFNSSPLKSLKPAVDARINILVKQLNRLVDGPNRLAFMIVSDLIEVFLSGRIEVEETWKTHMVESRFSTRDCRISKTLPGEEPLRRTLYSWCKGSRHGWSMYHEELTQRWAESKVNQLGAFEVSKGLVRVAVDFPYLCNGLAFFAGV
ncbi:hypothetical protein PGT21_021766 [Puccinia graminis f. sp. tritici]|uniref:Uncharacterized protein n=1 Tax=Puccinia graminis f. sp. tritici TaxID=56615 RepID=A0A5B0MM34_PUCGR|nr:hypothetical protein PGT21_021766 [Puccinia graminis f. sp. tritici]